MSVMRNSMRAFSESKDVLKANPSLLIFPILSFFSLILIVGLVMMGTWQTLSATLGPDWLAKIQQEAAQKGPKTTETISDGMRYGFFAVYAFVYFLAFTVANFFNTALMACALFYFQTGQKPTVSLGLNVAMQRFWLIVQWSALAAFVGVVLKALQERTGVIGQIIIGIVGIVWAVASYFVLPVLIIEGLSPTRALARSGALVKKTWGEGMTGAIGFGIVNILFIISLFCFSFIALSILKLNPLFVVATFLILAIGFSVVMAVVQRIYVTAVYVYATTGNVPPNYSQASITAAFFDKKAKRN